MARAGKPKQATQRTRERQSDDKAPLADSGDNANPADEIEALEAGGSDRSWRWHGANRTGEMKGDAGNKVGATEQHKMPRRARAPPRRPSPKGRT